jgi:glycosyltransferase involved in cell wall biosynthesis
MTFIYNEVTALSKEIDIVVACRHYINREKYPFDKVREFGEGNLVERMVSQLNKRLFRTDRNYWFQTAQQLNGIIEQEKPDLIHCQFGHSFIFLRDQLPKLSIPIIVSFHGFDASSSLEQPAYVRQLNRYFDDGVFPIFVSHDMRQTMLNKGVRFQNECILYYGTNIDAFERKNYTPPSPFTFLQVSSLTEKKGHLYTLRAFAKLLTQLSPPHPVLHIGGEGYLREEIEQEIEQLQISESVRLLGLMNNLQVKKAMENASCFVHHSITSNKGAKEGIPNVVMEAMAMELPILSTYHAGIPELVEDGVHGYLVKEKDVETYARKMQEIMGWGHQAKNREKVVQLFEREKRTQKLLAHYQRILNSSVN